MAEWNWIWFISLKGIIFRIGKLNITKLSRSKHFGGIVWNAKNLP